MKKYMILIVICSILFLGCTNEEPVKSKRRRGARAKDTSTSVLDTKVLELEKRIEELTKKQSSIFKAIDSHSRSIYNLVGEIEQKHPGTYSEWLIKNPREGWIKSAWTEEN